MPAKLLDGRLGQDCYETPQICETAQESTFTVGDYEQAEGDVWGKSAV